MSLLGSIAAVGAVLLVIYLLSRMAEARAKAHAPVHSETISRSHGQLPVPATSPSSSQPEKRHFFLQVHGIYYSNSDGSSRQKIIQRCRPGEVLQLVPEPDNPYDSDAIKVCRVNGEQLGYLDAAYAARITHDSAIGWTYQVTVDEIFAADRIGCFGCRLRIGVLTMSKRTEARKRNS